ncbi:MAG TPA: hypothetical protein VNH44_14410 [Micropepsaceae bacterium]|nr:hypothetical protein [Micropepsaceae bacterium]
MNPQIAARELLADIKALRAMVSRDGRARFRDWRAQITRPAFGASALNFAQYLALRRDDLRPLQRRLMVLGLSSLGRSEGHVLATLDAVTIALAALGGKRSFGTSEEPLALSILPR